MAKRKTWTEFLESAVGKEVWSVLRYIGPPRSNDIPSIVHNGTQADTIEDKARMLRNISFPPPLDYTGTEGEAGPAGTMYTHISP